MTVAFVSVGGFGWFFKEFFKFAFSAFDMNGVTVVFGGAGSCAVRQMRLAGFFINRNYAFF